MVLAYHEEDTIIPIVVSFSCAVPVQCLVCCLSVICLVTIFILIEKMGTPLSLLLNHFKDFQTQVTGLGIVIWKGQLTIFCRNEWLTLNV